MSWGGGLDVTEMAAKLETTDISKWDVISEQFPDMFVVTKPGVLSQNMMMMIFCSL